MHAGTIAKYNAILGNATELLVIRRPTTLPIKLQTWAAIVEFVGISVLGIMGHPLQIERQLAALFILILHKYKSILLLGLWVLKLST